MGFQNGIGPIAYIEHIGISTLTSVECIAAGSTSKPVIASATKDKIITTRTVEYIIAGASGKEFTEISAVTAQVDAASKAEALKGVEYSRIVGIANHPITKQGKAVPTR